MVSGRGKPLRWTRRRGTPVTWRWRLSGLVGQLHVVDVPQVLRNKAFAFGASEWLSTLDDRIAELEQQWSIQVGEVFDGATEAYVAMAIMSDGSPAVLKVVMPRAEEVMRHEMTVLRLADGQGCVRLLRESDVLGALLLERLGPALSELSVSLRERHEVLCSTVERLWRPAPGCGLPTGAEKGRWLIEFILATWEALNRPCNERAVEDAIACAERRIGAHDDELAMLVHGDVHQWNALRAEEGFKLVPMPSRCPVNLGVGRRRARLDGAALYSDRSSTRGAPHARRRRKSVGVVVGVTSNSWEVSQLPLSPASN